MKDYIIKDYQKPYQNLYDTLADSAMKYPDKVAVIDDEGEINYKDLLKRVDSLSVILKEQYQMQEQEQIGFLMVNSINMVTAFYAAMKIGCIAVMMNTKLKEREITHLLDITEVKLIFSDSRWLDKLEKTAVSHGIDNILTELTDFECGTHYANTISIQNLKNTAVIMHTSGTTGPPKGIMVTHQNILEAAYGYQEVQGLTDSALTVLSVPLFHILGLSCVTTYFIYMGATIVLSAFYDLDVVLQNIRKYKATHFHSVPAIYLQIIKSDSSKKDLSSLKVAVCGGAPISSENVDAFCKLTPNATLHLAYGMTETAGSGTLSAVHKGPLKAAPNVHMTVVDSEHNELEPGEIGELVFCGPCIAQGRWKSASLPEPHMYSGDVGYMDTDGHVYIIDRLKDIINRGGEKIFPMQIEETIMEYPGIAKAAVYAVGNEQYGEVPEAAIVLENGAKVNMDDLNEYLKERVAKFKLPTRIEVMRELPVTQNGKIRKSELRKLAEERSIKI